MTRWIDALVVLLAVVPASGRQAVGRAGVGHGQAVTVTRRGENPTPRTTAGKPVGSPRVPRAADGRPDIDGVWTYGTATPLERPAPFAGRRVVTDAEAEAFVRQAAAERRAVVTARLGVMEFDDGDRPWVKINGENVGDDFNERSCGSSRLLQYGMRD